MERGSNDMAADGSVGEQAERDAAGPVDDVVPGPAEGDVLMDAEGKRPVPSTGPGWRRPGASLTWSGSAVLGLSADGRPGLRPTGVWPRVMPARSRPMVRRSRVGVPVVPP